jgi:DNA replication licensing factor MCM5
LRTTLCACARASSEQLSAHYNSGEYYLEVSLDHLLAFDEPLANALMARPGVHLQLFEDAAKEAAVLIAVTPHARMEDLIDIQVLLSASKHPSTIREMLSQQVSRLVHIPGIITHAARPKPKVTVAMAMCKKCGDKLPLINRAGLGNKTLPRTCGRQPLPGEERCPIDPYTVRARPPRAACARARRGRRGARGRWGFCANVARVGCNRPSPTLLLTSKLSSRLRAAPPRRPAACPGSSARGLARAARARAQVLPEESKFIDQQQLKLQEAPEAVPTGEMPRTLKLIVDRTLVGKVTPGSRCTVTGVYTVITSKPNDGKPSSRGGSEALAIREPYLRVVGLKVGIDTDGKHSLARFTADEEESFRQLARSGDVYARITKSIAPSICGRDDVKAAVACLLFGGTRKRLADGMHLRGDVNVLLLGDPSVAKSQFLKFAEKVAPIGVYTSGKGSSAAGLTAMVTQEPGTRDFYLEGGAMVLADGGIVCIDEFDKMREQDRVAIHEAMEQQTISIAKAGITTILNSRAAVLAAANPAFGAYDDSQELENNLDLGATILSRFDLIFILRDLRNEELDAMIARHVVGLHTQGGAPKDAADGATDEIAIEELQRYIHYCRTRCFPRLTESAAQVLQGHYVKFREQMRVLEDNGGGGIPITVRQLEAIIRVAEALAKMVRARVPARRALAPTLSLRRPSGARARAPRRPSERLRPARAEAVSTPSRAHHHRAASRAPLRARRS